MIDTILAEIKERFEDEKIKLYKERLADIGIVLNVENESHKRFPNTAIATHDVFSETWYYNDGSDDGLKVLTFSLKDSPINGEMAIVSHKFLQVKYHVN